jgi:hypothetical protein
LGKLCPIVGGAVANELEVIASIRAVRSILGIAVVASLGWALFRTETAYRPRFVFGINRNVGFDDPHVVE